MNETEEAVVDSIVAAIVEPSESPVATEEVLPDQPAPAPEEALTSQPATEEVQQVETEAAKAYTLMYFCMLPLKPHRNSLRTDLLKSGGEDPTLAVNVSMEGGMAPKGWSYFYTGADLNPRLVAHPDYHRIRQWHVKRFTSEGGGIFPSSLYKVECTVCWGREIIPDHRLNDIIGEGAENPDGLLCPNCSTPKKGVNRIVTPFGKKLHNQDKHVIGKVAAAMDKQNLNWGPLLPRVYGVYFGRWAKAVRYNIPTAWEPVDEDERWLQAEMMQLDKTAAIRPYSLCAKLAQCSMYPKYWYMLTKQETCGWVPVDAIEETYSRYEYVNGQIRGWSIDLITEPPNPW
jgi:hypothetical protein